MQEKQLFRRFRVIGTETQKDRLFALMEEKNLSREDITLILSTLSLNPDTSE